MLIPYPLREQWAITAEGREKVLAVYHAAHTLPQAERIAAALEARGGEPFPPKPQLQIVDGVAIIGVDGPLMRKAGLLADISGACSYDWLGAQVDECRTNPEVKAVIIRANSPGGEAAGCAACAGKIAKLRAVKHVEGYVDTQAASAMYWQLSQCTHITAHRSAEVGWIGVIRDMVDTSKADEQAGIKRMQLVSDGAEEKRSVPIDADVIARAQRRVDEMSVLFNEDVAAGRGVSVDDVRAKFGVGDGMIAGRALEAGLIDAIGEFEETLASVVETARNPTQSTAQPAAPRPGSAQGADTMKRDAKAQAAAPGTPKDKAKASAPGAKAESGGKVDGEDAKGGKAADDGDEDEDDKPDAEGDDKPDAEGDEPDAEGDDEDDEDDDEPGEKKDEARALAGLGLKPGASRREIMLALAAGAAVPLDKVASIVEQRVQQAFANRDKATAAAKAKSKAEELGARYASYGAEKEEVKAITDLAKLNYASAERIVNGHPGAKLGTRMTSGGAPVGGGARRRAPEAKDNSFNGGLAAAAQEMVESKDPAVMARIAKRAGKNASPGMRLAIAQQIVAEDNPELLEEAPADE